MQPQLWLGGSSTVMLGCGRGCGRACFGAKRTFRARAASRAGINGLAAAGKFLLMYEARRSVERSSGLTIAASVDGCPTNMKQTIA